MLGSLLSFLVLVITSLQLRVYVNFRKNTQKAVTSKRVEIGRTVMTPVNRYDRTECKSVPLPTRAIYVEL